MASSSRFISSIGMRLPWSASVLVTTAWPSPSGRQVELSSPSAKSLGGQQLQQAELVLPAEAVGPELVEQVEHRQVAAQLLAGGRGVEVLGVGAAKWKVTPLSWTNLEASSTRLSAIRLPRSTSQAWSTLCSLKPMG